MSTLSIHGVKKKNTSAPEHCLFTCDDMTLSSMTLNVDGYRFPFYGIQGTDKETALLLQNVEGHIQAQGYSPCVAWGFYAMLFTDCGPSREHHAGQDLNYGRFRHLCDGENDCRELYLSTSSFVKVGYGPDPDRKRRAQDNDTIYNKVDEAPQFPGSNEAMQKYIQENLFSNIKK